MLIMPFSAFAAPVSWDFTGGILQPLQSAWSALVKANRFQATSTSAASIFPYASTTALSATSLCLSTDCRTVWPGSGAGTVSTSSSETAGYFPTWTTTNGTPALLAGTSQIFQLGSNIGIGTTTPGFPLTVAGNAVAGYFTAQTVDATSTFNGNFSVPSGHVQVGSGLDYNGPAGKLLSVIEGDGSAITKAGPTVKITRLEDMSDSLCVNRFDNLCNAALSVQSVGIASTLMQVNAIDAHATTYATTLNRDAFGISGRGMVTGSGVGIGGGGYFEGTRSTATGMANGAEIRVVNNTNTDCDVSTTGFSKCIGLWITDSSTGNKNVSSAIQVGYLGTSRFLTGIGFNSDSIASTTFSDNSFSQTSISVLGTHSYAFVSGASSGNVGIGTVLPTAQLQVATTSQGTAFQVSTSPTAAVSGFGLGMVNAYIASTSGGTTGTILALNNSASVLAADTSNWTTLSGASNSASYSGSGTVGTITGSQFTSARSGAGTGSATTLQGISVGITNSTGSGSVAIGRGLFVNRPVGGAGTVYTNTYGLFVSNQTVAAGTQTNLPFGIFQEGTGDRNYFAGKTGIGTTSPYASLSIGGDVVVGAATAAGTLGDLYLPKLGTAAGSFLAVDANGKVIATTTPSGGGGSGITSLNGLTGATQTFATTSANGGFGFTSTGTVHTFNIPTANATNLLGLLSNTDWSTFNGKQAAGNYITALTGDGTAAGPGSTAFTLATVNSNVGTFNTLTVNGKGLVTAASNTSYENPLTFTYPLTRTTNTIALAFSTTTSNTWAGTQTFTNSPVFSILTAGSVNATTGGTIYNTATSTPTLGLGLAYSGTLGQFISGVSGSLTIATSSLYTGTIGQFPYFSGTNTITATSSLYLATSGNVGVGTTSPYVPFSASSNNNGVTAIFAGNNPLVQIGSSTPPYGYLANDRLNTLDNRNDYSVINAYNFSAGNCATADFSASNDLASNASFFVDLGHTSSGFTGSGCANNPFTGFGANSSYLFDPSGNINFAVGSTSANTSFRWFTGGYGSANEKMRLTNGGNLGIGTSTPLGTLSINAAAQSNPYFVIGSSTSQVFSISPSSSATLGVGTSTPWRSLSVTGTVGFDGLTASSGLQTGILCLSANKEVINESVACVASAKRYKENINNLTPGLDELMKLRPVSFTWKKDYLGNNADDPNQNGVQYSLIADEVQKIDPHLVSLTTSETTFEGKVYPAGSVNGLADMNHWVALIVKSIQDIVHHQSDQDKKIQSLQNQIKTLQNEIDSVQNK